MDADSSPLLAADLTEKVLCAFYRVYNELGSGFVESVYENALVVELQEQGVSLVQQPALQVQYRGRVVGDFRADLIVDNRVLVEVKAVSMSTTAHEVQLVNYLKATGVQVGLLLNFGPTPEFRRRVRTSAQRAMIRVESAQIGVKKKCSPRS